MVSKKISQLVSGIVRKGKSFTDYSQTSGITEHNIYVLFPELKIRIDLQDLRITVGQNAGEHAGKFTSDQIEKLCKLKRDLEPYINDDI